MANVVGDYCSLWWSASVFQEKEDRRNPQHDGDTPQMDCAFTLFNPGNDMVGDCICRFKINGRSAYTLSIALTARIWIFSTFVSDGLAAVRRVNGGNSAGQSLNSPNECSSISSGSFCCGCRGQRSAPRQLSYAVTLLTGMNETDSCLYCEGRGGGEFGGCH